MRHQGFRNTRRRFSAEEKISIVREGLRGEKNIATLCRRKGIVPNLYCAPSDRSGFDAFGRWLTR